MEKITPKTEIEEVLHNIESGEVKTLNNSNRRREQLEKFAQLRSKEPKTTVELKDTKTSFVKPNKKDSGEFVNVTITTRNFPQPDNYNLPEKYHNYVMQKAFVIHESAHIVYSSYPEYKKYLENFNSGIDITGEELKVMKQNIFNILEDGAIEKFVCEDYNVDKEILHMRKSIHENQSFSMRTGTGEANIYPLYQAIMVCLLNVGVYDNGVLDKILDESNEKYILEDRSINNKEMEDVVSELENYIQKIQNERIASKRGEICQEVWELIYEKIKEHNVDGGSVALKKDKKIKGEGAGSYMQGVPANLSGGHKKQKNSSQTDRDRSSTSCEKTIVEKREMEEKSEAEKIKEIKEEVTQDLKNQNEKLKEELREVISSLEGGEGTDEIFIRESGDINIETRSEAKKLGKRCEKIFRKRLQKKKREKEVKNQRRGDLDSKKLYKTKRQSTKIFSKKEKEGEKNYSCTIVCDRSASMSRRIENTEIAVGSLTYALESLGVDVSILDTYKNKTAICKPFNMKVEDCESKMFCNQTSGGTPLQHTVSYSKQRIDRGKNDYPLLIIITDGGVSASGKEKFKQEVRNSNFPVLGVYLSDDIPDEQKKLYNGTVCVSRDEKLTGELVSLINSIFF